jgi:hypothetical protein
MYNVCSDILLFFLYAKLNIQEAEIVVFADDTNKLVIEQKKKKKKKKKMPENTYVENIMEEL